MDYEALAELLLPNVKGKISDYEEKYPVRDIEENAMVTRFAPSPTGLVHLGSLYASFLNRLYADQSKGIFYLRIEDTDQKRELANGIEVIKNAMDYFNVPVDESLFSGGIYGPYVQSERKEIYQTYVKEMLRKGLAYPCFCTHEDLEAMHEQQNACKARTGYYGRWAVCRKLTFNEIKQKVENKEPYIIRMKTNVKEDQRIEFEDLIKGKIFLPANDMDHVILKSDGLPTYHFAHMVDDHLMHTTHVIRGDEWIPSVPIHIQLFEMMGFKAPRYAHISPLTKKDGNSIRKLSKRKDPEFSITYYKEEGIPVEGIKLYFATITNSNFEQWYMQNKDNNFMNFKFEFNKMPIGGTLFDIEKLNFICKLYFSQKTGEELYIEALAYYKEYDIDFYNLLINNKDYAIKVLNIERNRPRPRKDIGCYKDIKKETSYMFDELFNGHEDYQDSLNDNMCDAEILDDYINNYYDDTSEDGWYNRIKELAVKYNYAADTKSYKLNPEQYKGHVGDICETIRYAVTGRHQTPSLFEVQNILGVDIVKDRINKFKAFLANK